MLSIDDMPVSASKMTITGLNDQHADLRSTPGTEQPVRVVSVSSLSAAQICTTFDRWRHLAMVDV